MPRLSVEAIGREREPVAVIDNFAPDPHALRTTAITQTFSPDVEHYPGLKAPVTRAYIEATGAVIARALADVFGCANGAALLGAWYQIVTTPPATLSLEQRVPHFDAVEPGRFAVVHYLTQDDQGGTSFYRHRSTGFETIGAARVQPYFSALNAEIAKYGRPDAAYIADASPLFERIATFAPVFNRALIYPSRLLHSGAIRSDVVLSPDPLRGRLTVGVFLAAN